MNKLVKYHPIEYSYMAFRKSLKSGTSWSHDSSNRLDISVQPTKYNIKKKGKRNFHISRVIEFAQNKMMIKKALFKVFVFVIHKYGINFGYN